MLVKPMLQGIGQCMLNPCYREIGQCMLNPCYRGIGQCMLNQVGHKTKASKLTNKANHKSEGETGRGIGRGGSEIMEDYVHM